MRIIRCSVLVSTLVSEEVGSSITITRASDATARRISTFCLSAVRSAPTLAFGSSSNPHWETSSWYCRRIRPHWTNPARRGSMPKKMFSITLMCGTGESSCEIVAIPSMRASRGLA